MTALSIGVGGFIASVTTPSYALASSSTSASTADLAAAAASGVPLSLESSERPTPTGVPINEQPFEATLSAATATATVTASDVVRAARTVTSDTATPKLTPGDRLMVPVSFYYCQSGGGAQGDGGGFCGAMRDGSVVYSGAAACDVVYLGQRFRIEGDPSGRTYRCADTGSAVHGLHRDIWFGSNAEGWAWQRSIGQAATIEVLP